MGFGMFAKCSTGLIATVFIIATTLFLISMAGAVPDNKPVLVPNQTSSEAAANMTRMLIGDWNSSKIICPATRSAYVQITPNVCLFDMTVPVRCLPVNGFVAPLYATYLKQHPDYEGDLVLNVYAQDKTLLMTTTITNADARANYDGIAYVMDKNAADSSKRTDGLETPMGY
jgi:hypothetical protein